MKYASAAAMLAVFLSPLPAGAAVVHHVPHRAAATCTPGFLGCPPANATPVPFPRPIVTPPSANATMSTGDLISALTQAPAEIIANLQQADAYEAAPINPATGAAWNITAHQCIVGMPAQGTPGQTGYVPASTGLIGFIQTLPLVTSSNSVPPLPGPTSAMCIADKAATPNPASTALDCTSASPATVAVYLQNQLTAASGVVGGIVNQINTGGFPQWLTADCGGEVNFSINQGVTVASQVAAIDALFAKYVLPVMAAHKGPAK